MRSLYAVLDAQAASPRVRSAYEEWAGLVSLATEYDQRNGKPAKSAHSQRASHTLDLGGQAPDSGHVVFVTHTLFAILAKLIAFSAVSAHEVPASQIESSDTGMPLIRGRVNASVLGNWASLSDAGLARRFQELEDGSIFQAAGMINFLEGDCFGWYAHYFTSQLLDCLRAVVARLAEYDFSSFDTGVGQSPDLLKELYLRLVSPSVRKALGEYYTPDWLAQRLLDLLEGGEFCGDPGKRLLDPACGSGTFLVLAINAVQRNSRARSMERGELLRAICQSIAGIDLNPVAVMAARANYVLALGSLLRHRGKEPLKIPVHLGDSIQMPAQQLRLSLSETAHALADTRNPSPHIGSCKALSDSSFDYVVGNPPWIGWENLPEDYRRATKDLWHEHGLFVHRGMDTILGKGRKDLSMLMTYVAAEHYLKKGGRLGFVITQAVFKMAGAGQGFRRFVTRGGTPLHCERVEDYSSVQLFQGATTRAALFVMKKSEPQKYPIPYLVFRTRLSKPKRGFDPATRRRASDQPGLRTKSADRGSPSRRTPELSCEEGEAEPSDPRDPASPWLTGNSQILQTVRKVLGKSDYQAHQGVNTGGANAVYWFQILAEDGEDGVMARNLIGAAKRKIPSQAVALEKRRLFPLLRGRDVSAWQAKPTAWLLFVQDVKTRRGISKEQMAGTPKTLQWLEQNKQLLVSRAAYRRFFDPVTDPFWSMFDVGQYTLKLWKVVWPRIAWRLEAAVVSELEGKPILAQETLSFVGLDDEAEAHYVAGVINSTPFRFAVSAFSQRGSKSFGTPSILEKARIPRFDPASSVHQRISAESKRLSGGSPDAAKMAQEGLDALCRGLWGLSDNELQAIQQACAKNDHERSQRLAG